MSDAHARKEKLQRFFIIGTILLVVALIMWLIPTVYIGSIDGRLDLLEIKSSLSEAEQQMLTDLRWSKIWWITTQTTVFNPTATILMIIGLVLIAYGFVVRFA